MSNARVQIQGGGPVLPIEGFSEGVTPQSVNYTLLMDATVASRIVTLPPSSAHPGRIYIIKRTDSSGNTVTVAASGLDTIDGAASVALTALASIEIQSDGEGLWSALASFGLGGGGGITGGGTLNFIPRWTGATSIGDSVIQQSGVNIGIGGVPGAFQLDVFGDTRVQGKLTVTGAIDPTSILLSGGTALFFESNDGVTAPISGAATGRIRYNNTTGTWQVSTQGGAYASISTGGGGIGGSGTTGRVPKFTAATTIGDSSVEIGTGPDTLIPVTDSTTALGTSTRRWVSVNATAFNLISTLGDANPTAAIQGSKFVLGPGGATGPDCAITRTAANTMTIDDNAGGAGNLIITGKLTVVGAIDPVSVLLSGSTALFFESNDGSTAPLSGAATGRIRYNNTTGTWQVSTQGGAYATIGSGVSGTGVAGQVTFFTGAATVAGDTGLTYDSTNDALTVGVARIHSTGTSNTFVGQDAGNFTLTGTLNSAFGFQAADAITSGIANSAFGTNALGSTTTANQNSGFGANALTAATTGGDNSAFGTNALGALTTATSSSAFGTSALIVSTASDNCAFGANALDANTTGTRNNAFGRNALGSNTTADDCTAFGHEALALSTGILNSAFGSMALDANTTGLGNCAFGSNALGANTSANQNNAFGANALLATTTGVDNCAFGTNTLAANVSGTSNCAFGTSALILATASDLSAFGANALDANTTGARNGAFGRNALGTNITGNDNSAFGFEAMAANTGNNNSAFGSQALDANTTGNNSCAFGLNALGAQTTGSENTGFGVSALLSNVTGNNNCAFGMSALENNTATGNSAFGTSALTANTTGTGLSAFGLSAMVGNTTGTNNSAFGDNALRNITTAGDGSAFGYHALFLATGASNSGFGTSAGAALTTGDSCTFIGATADTTLVTAQNATAIGFGATVGASNTMVFGNSAVVTIIPGSDNTVALGTTAAKFLSVSIGGQLEMTERAADPGATANIGKLYTKDVAGTTQLFFQRDDATVVQIT